MRILVLCLGALGLALTGPPPGLAADTTVGEALVRDKCVGCHGEEAYAAAGRKVASVEGLKRRVEACSEAAETGWTDAQKADVVRYLNQKFYGFR